MMLDVSTDLAPPSWHVIVPVRGGPAGKTRLTSLEDRGLTADDRLRLALAMASDTVRAAVASRCGPVSVVTADPGVSRVLVPLGAGIVPDLGRGLNAELTAAASAVPAEAGVLILLGDVPTVRAEDVRAVVDEIARHGAGFVPDWEGTGTAVVGSVPLAPRPGFAFGPASARRHEALGLPPVGTGLDRLRCDVDTAQAWARAVGLGLGPATSAARQSILARART